jgi:hypothetical protein
MKLRRNPAPRDDRAADRRPEERRPGPASARDVSNFLSNFTNGLQRGLDERPPR